MNNNFIIYKLNQGVEFKNRDSMNYSDTILWMEAIDLLKKNHIQKNKSYIATSLTGKQADFHYLL